MIDFYNLGNYLCAVCGSVWTRDGVDRRFDMDDDEVILFLAHKGCRDCMHAKGCLLDRLIQAEVVQPGALDDALDENMGRFFAPAYYAVMQSFSLTLARRFPRFALCKKCLHWLKASLLMPSRVMPMRRK